MLLINCWMRCFSHSRHGFPHTCSVFLQEYFIFTGSLFRPKPFVSFNWIQRSVLRHLFLFSNTKFFRQVGTCLKIDAPLLFSYVVRLGHDYISVREWLKEWFRVHFFLTSVMYLRTTHKYRREYINFYFNFVTFFGSAIHEINTQTCKTKIYLPTNTGVLISP